MRRILVAGISGAGKSTLARRLSAVLDLPYVEMDELFHGPGWVPRASFVDDVRALAARPAWITEWQHSGVRPMLLERADTVVWLDYDRPVVMGRVLRRSLARTVLRRRLFNGNVERWRHWLEPDHPVRWAWTRLERKRADNEAAFGAAGHIELHRFRRPSQAGDWLRTLER